ncbi:MATE family efflux transporter [Candidatus Eisenbacteria bacterium]|uniref:Multidrug-efflux transporter n=1 Tax=Eiseniibacteriota bacterium TaxID=2212470 RepID=A0ABV6YJM5_UNCEI
MGGVPGTKYTEGSIIASILRMGVPSMIGFAMGNIYDLADAYWLSRLGPTPVAAITILGPFLWVIHSANMIVGAGSVAVISRRYGEGDLLKTELAIRETIVLKWIAAIAVGAIGFFTVPYIVRLLGAEGEAIEYGIVYGRIIFAGLGFYFATYSVFTALRGVSNPNKAMILMLAFTALNIVLDPFLIFGWWIFPAMGVAGAAWASVISYAAGFITGMIVLCAGGANVRLRLRSGFPVQWAMMSKILTIGAPTAIGSISFSLARLVIMPMISVFGMGVVAAYGVGTRISALGIMMLVGIGLGLSALIGHNMGAGKRERARRTANQAILLSVGVMTTLAAVVFVGAEFIMQRFFDDPEIVAHGVELMRILAIGFPFIGLYITIENVYGGVGENRPAMIFNILHAWILEVPAVYIFTKLLGWDQAAVWWAISGASVVSTLAFYLYFRRGKWLDVEV